MARSGPAGGAALMARDLRLFYVFRLLATSYLWVPVFVFFMKERGLTWAAEREPGETDVESLVKQRTKRVGRTRGRRR